MPAELSPTRKPSTHTIVAVLDGTAVLRFVARSPGTLTLRDVDIVSKDSRDMADDPRTEFRDGMRVTSDDMRHMQDRLREAVLDIRRTIGLGKIGGA